MKKIIFWGDPLLTGSAGYAELLGNHVFLHYPRADLSLATIPAASTHGEAGGPSLSDAFREAPLHAIGKDPDLLYLGFGDADLAAGQTPDEAARLLQDLVTVVLQKTHARIALSQVISAFFPEALRAACQAFNRRLQTLAGPRVTLLDLDGRVEAFLREHRESPGDQRALHVDTGRLTPLGQLLLAHHAFALTPWPDFQAQAILVDR